MTRRTAPTASGAIAEGLEPLFDWNAWPLPPVFAWLQQVGGVEDHELRRTFNCGVGFILVVKPQHAEAVLSGLLDAEAYRQIVTE